MYQELLAIESKLLAIVQELETMRLLMETMPVPQTSPIARPLPATGNEFFTALSADGETVTQRQQSTQVFFY